MLKQLTVLFLAALLASCSSLRPIGFTNNKPTGVSASEESREPRFLDISSADESHGSKSSIKSEHTSGPNAVTSTEPMAKSSNSENVSKLSPLQLKYSQLLNTTGDQIQNVPLYQVIDAWYGTRYRLGGASKEGIDCSAFVQAIYSSAFAINLPRMARDQYRATRRISRTRLREGDLLFFNTRGGISHVGIYLQNNKFVHASVSGVTISDMFEPYYVKHFVAAGRVSGIGGNSIGSVTP
jgi:cell wall-associated NlpC family hydrolase